MTIAVSSVIIQIQIKGCSFQNAFRLFISRLYAISRAGAVDQWKTVTLEITNAFRPGAKELAVSFTAIRGNGYHGDIAIDDVTYYDRPCAGDRKYIHYEKLVSAGASFLTESDWD